MKQFRTRTRTDRRPIDRRKVILRSVVLALVFALFAGACAGGSDSPANFQSISSEDGGGSDSFSDTTAAPATTIAARPQTPGLGVIEGDDRAEIIGGGRENGTGGIGSTPLPINLNRDIIFTADLQIAVTDVAAASAEATQRVEALGGFLFGQQTVGGTEPRSILVFKIIPEQFRTALDQLGSIGDLRNQTVSADDVTERVVNLESQISTNQASVDRLRDLLQGAGSVDELARLEAQLLQRETTLEQLRGSLRTLEDQVALATITVRIEEARLRPGIEAFATAYPGFEDNGSSCPGATQQLTVDRDTFATICWEIRNVGDTDLTGFQLTDTVLDITIGDVIVVDGDPDQLLEPGDTLLLAYGVEVDRRLRPQTRVSAIPVTADGVVLEDRTVASTTSVTLRSEDPGGIPSFSEGLSRSWRALVGFFEVVLLTAGLALPFIWVPFVVYFLALWIRRRGDRRDAELIAASTDVAAPPQEPVEVADEIAESESPVDVEPDENADDTN